MPRRSSPLLIDHRYRHDFNVLAAALEELGFKIFETYRSDEDQLTVFNLGTSKAKPGESPHQWGMAVDFVPYGPNGWHWPKADDPLWAKMHQIVDSFPSLSKRIGPDIPWDSPHVEVVNWKALKSERHRAWCKTQR